MGRGRRSKSKAKCPHKLPLSGPSSKIRDVSVLQLMQRGLVYPAPYARFCLFWLQNTITRDEFADMVFDVNEKLAADYSNTTSAVFGVSFKVFKQWCQDEGVSAPVGMNYRFPNADDSTSEVFERSHGIFKDSSGDIFVHIKSDDNSDLEVVYDFIRGLMQGKVTEQEAFEDCDSRNVKGSDTGRVLGCRFAENLNNPADPVTVVNHTVIGYNDIDHAGGSFVLAQRFQINWRQLHNLSEEGIEDIIGRTEDDILLPGTSFRSHIKCGRFRDEKGDTQFVMRLGLPFGQSDYKSPEILEKGSNIRDEKGIFFAGFSRSVKTLEGIMDQQIGPTEGFMQDRLFDNVISDLGGFFYIPSLLDLHSPSVNWILKDELEWDSFPGIDWTRLSRHFTEKSPNGLMYYNHKNYLYEMSTMKRKLARIYNPPSDRILTLLLDMFTVWQDTWYFKKKQQDMGHLKEYITLDFGEEKATQVMQRSIMLRKGWATRMTCRLYSSDEYGFRGTRDIDGVEVCGADTFRIHPSELIVGAMPDLTLGQGRYIIKYLNEEEEMPSFFSGISESSGVGHVVPDFQKLVDRGLGGLLTDIETRKQATKESKQDFYEACALSIKGVQEFLSRYADLAERDAGLMTHGQEMEKINLKEIAVRLRKLMTEKPETMIEAAQLIFTMFTCLHYNGEPIAIGRFDQYLNPFYEADLNGGRLTDDYAQEIIDAFWIKIDEKVLQNRLNMQDHQPPGNLAMGGSSGPYPQGASLNQWVQQLTVGGVVASENEVEEMAYNNVTKMCIRAAARLPLNAPCLSLRVNKNTPADILEEAARAILSGGAHPIFLNDDKIIPGLLACGKDIGKGGCDNSNEYTPVAEKANGKWNSNVSLTSARNYACDGCYEPMFVGQNWFNLGGFSTLDPLECALNKGRTYGSAGVAFLKGKSVSFRSRGAEEINSFQELLDLYFEHFYKMWARAFNSSLTTFDAIASYCPCPLLSLLIDDCVSKGLDIYGGGAKHNVYGPCWTALSSTINSLYNINKMVFDKDTAVTSLPELVLCLMCDWGENMTEPFFSATIGKTRLNAKAERFRRLREISLSHSKYGRGNKNTSDEYREEDRGTYSVDQLGNYICGRICDLTVKVLADPFASTSKMMLTYAEKYGTVEHPFGFQIIPGVGTFENFVAFGESSGASADGRHNGEWIASDLSPSPSPMDEAPNLQLATFSRALQGFTGEGTDAFWEGAPVDFNIAEDFPKDKLVDILKDFTSGNGPNILTITCVSPENMQSAMERHEQFDLLRVRMGGWSEFFTAMFPSSQDQHCHRPISTADEVKSVSAAADRTRKEKKRIRKKELVA